jgi:hypothetical protein
MSDRDTFAAAALTGMMSRVSGKAEAFAEAAYKLADAMLRERGNHSEKPNSSPTLTDAEREAVHWFAHYGLPEHRAATLRSLLERLHT